MRLFRAPQPRAIPAIWMLKDWILGEQFTAAAAMLGSSAIFLRQFNMLPDSHNIGDYADRCAARETYQRALAAAGE